MATKNHPSIASRIKHHRELIAEFGKLNPFLKHIESLFEGSGSSPNDANFNRDRRVRLSWWGAEVEMSFNYDHVLADVDDLKTLRAAGYYQSGKYDWHKPQTDKTSGTTTYTFFHKDWKDGDAPVAKLLAGIREGDTATCKKVKVRTETRQVDVYEVRCNGMEIDEAPQIVETETSRIRES